MNGNRRRLTCHLGALAMVVAAFLVWRALSAVAGTPLPTFITFYPTIMLAALYGGFGPGLTATVLAAFLADYLMLPPVGSLQIATLRDVLSLGLFCGMGIFISVVAELYRRARKKSALYDALGSSGQAPGKPALAGKNLLLDTAMAVSLAFLLGIGWVSYAEIRAEETADALTVRSYQVIQDLDRLLSSLKDAETGQRGYLLSGDEHYLEPYRAGLSASEQHLNALQQLIRDPVQKERLAGIQALVNAKLGELGKTIELRRDQGFRAALGVVLTDQGKLAMDRIRDLVTAAQAAEQRHLKERNDLKEAAARKALQVLLAGGVLDLLLLTLVFLFLKEENGRRVAAEAEVARHRDSLQDLVAERTRELADSEMRLRRLYESGILGITYWNTEGAITGANDKFLDMVGYTREEFSNGGIDWQNLTPVGCRHLDELALRELRETGVNKKPFEKEFLRKDGTPFPVMIAGAMLDEARSNGVAFVLDITEQKEAAAALAERSAQLENANLAMRQSRSAALSMMEDAVIAQRQTEQVSAQLQRTAARLDLLAGIAGELLASDSPQEIVERLCRKVMEFLDCQCFFNFLVNEETDCLRLNACAGITAEEREKIEWLDYGVAICGCAARDACRIVADDIFHTPDPRTELVKSYGIQAYACHPLLSHGRLLGTLSFGTRTRTSFSEEDLALMKAVADQVSIAMERKQAESDLLKAKEKADSATRAKSQFLANMSHELRTPMTGVIGMLDLVLMEELATGQRECIVTAHKAAHSLVRILNDILDMTKIEAGKLVIEEKPFSLRRCVKETFDILLPAARSKGLQLVAQVADDLPVMVSGDQTRVSQVLTNLAGNAVKFTAQGKVEIAVTSGGEESGGRSPVIFTVTDTGIGIPEAKQDLLFREFSQVDESHSRRYGGTGLGLAISKEIVERMGGTIRFLSEEGAGSTFTFSVPFGTVQGVLEERQEVAEEHKPSAAGTDSLTQPRLLLVEDDPTIGSTLLTMLRRFNYQVELAENGLKAVEMWENGSYDLILMDVQMPLLNGFEATGIIRDKEGPGGDHIPIIAMTAHALKEDQVRCLEAGMDAYISKPIDFAASLKLIKETLNHSAG